MKHERIYYILLLCFCAVGCSIDIEITDRTLASGSIDFSNAENFEFNENYVEVNDGELRLKALDLERSGSEFSLGSHVGSSANTGRLGMDTGRDNVGLDEKDLRFLLPTKTPSLIGYWKFDGDLKDSSQRENHGSAIGDAALVKGGVTGGGLSEI